MKDQQVTREMISSLKPDQVSRYLQAHGWVVEHESNRSSVWAHSQEKHEILLPLDKRLADYTLRMADVLDLISQTEGKSVSEVVGDLLDFSLDSYRIRWVNDNTEPGQIPLQAGVQLYESMKTMLKAAAASAISPRPNYPPKQPNQVEEYLRNVRLAVPEKGSYIVSMKSPISLEQMSFVGEPEPFERQVLIILNQALSQLRNLSDSGINADSFASMQEIVSMGLSSNLCNAIADVLDEGAQRLEVSVSWSPLKPRPPEPPIIFDRRLAVTIREIAERLQDHDVIEHFELIGMVTQLVRPPRSEVGRVAVQTFLESHSVTVSIVHVDPVSYSVFTRAHDERQSVRCLGDLVHHKKHYALMNLQDVKLKAEVDE